jgi:hypothetical protein
MQTDTIGILPHEVIIDTMPDITNSILIRSLQRKPIERTPV